MSDTYKILVIVIASTLSLAILVAIFVMLFGNTESNIVPDNQQATTQDINQGDSTQTQDAGQPIEISTDTDSSASNSVSDQDTTTQQADTDIDNLLLSKLSFAGRSKIIGLKWTTLSLSEQLQEIAGDWSQGLGISQQQKEQLIDSWNRLSAADKEKAFLKWSDFNTLSDSEKATILSLVSTLNFSTENIEALIHDFWESASLEVKKTLLAQEFDAQHLSTILDIVIDWSESLSEEDKKTFNPNGCNLRTQGLAADKSCIPRSQPLLPE